MATERDEIRIDITGSSAQFEATAKRVNRLLDTLQGNADRASTSTDRAAKSQHNYLKMMRDTAITLALLPGAIDAVYRTTVGWQKAIADTNGEIERMRFLLRGMSEATTVAGQMQDAEEQTKRYLDIAEQMPFSLNAIMDSAVKMKSVGIDPLAGSLNAMSDAVAAFGGDEHLLHRATIAIQQMGGKGVVSMEELRQQLGEAVPSAVKLMARSVGLSYKELVDEISKGNVSAAKALPLLMQEFSSNFQGSADELMNTWGGMLQRLQTRWTKFQLAIGDAGYFDVAKQALQGLIDIIGSEGALQAASYLGTGMRNLWMGVQKLGQMASQYKEPLTYLFQAVLGTFVFTAIRRFSSFLLLTKEGVGRFAGLAGAAAQFSHKFGLAMEVMKVTPGIFGRVQFAAAGLSAALTGLRAAAMALLGPMNIIAGVLTAGAYLWYQYGKSGTEALDKLNEGAFQTSESLDAALADMEVVQRQQDKLAKEIDRYTKVLDSRSASETQKKIAKERLAELQQTYDAGQKLLEKGREQHAVEMQKIADRESQRILERKRMETSQVVQEANVRYRNEAEAAEKAYAGELITREEYWDKITELGKKKRLEIIEAEKEALQRIQDERDGLDLETSSLEELKAIDTAREAQRKTIRDLREELDRFIESRQNMNAAFLDGLGGGDTDDKLKKQYEQLIDYVASIEDNAAKSQTELYGLNSEVARFQYMLEEGRFADIGKTLSADEIQRLTDRIREASKAQAEAEAALERRKEAEKALGDIAKEVAEAQETYNEALLRYQGLSENQVEMEMMRRHFEEVRATIQAAGGDLSLFDARVQAFFDTAAKANQVTFLADMREELDQLNQELLPDNERLWNEYRQQGQEAIANARIWAIEDVQLKKQAAEDLKNYLVALNKTYAKETQSPLMSLAANWLDVNSQMQNASVGWLRSFVDTMVDSLYEGKNAWKDFADEVIKQLMRIAIQQSVAGILSGLTPGGAGPTTGLSMSATAGASASGYSPSVMSNWSATQGAAPSSLSARSVGFTSSPASAVAPPAGSRSTGPDSVNIINNTGVAATGSSQTRYDSDGKMVLDVVLDGVNKPGPFRDSMKNRMR